MEFKYSCLIVDDEYPAHDVIKSFIASHGHLVYAKSCYNGEDALKELSAANYDIVFLDINMPLLNGIEVLKKLGSIPAIIITTAYTKFAFEAYQNDALDYLQKPITIERFNKAISKAIEYANSRRQKTLQCLILKVDGLKQKVNQKDIVYCQSMGNFIKFFIVETSKPIITNQTLSKQLSLLDPELFLQIHRTCIVNKLFIARRKENLLVLKNGVELPIGRKFIQSVYSINI